ncbi:hypothetical protein [Microbacterium sp.]|uniref:hypothetical protein n=1 Tax=Microbacterium sp. TaxID=51671 RepID=UPI0039E64B09
MNVTGSTHRTHVASAAAPTTRFRRVTGAVALPTAFLAQLVCNSIYAWTSTSSGLSDTGSTADAYAFYALFPAEMMVATMFALVGVLLAIPGLLAALHVLRPARPRLALWAVVLMIAGYICYFGVVFTNFDTLALATAHIDAADALDASTTRALAVPFFLLFVAGNLLGTLLLGLAVILGGGRIGVPRWAGALIMGWTVGHLINIFGGGEWFAVAGGALEVTGLIVLARAALRLSDVEWARRG